MKHPALLILVTLIASGMLGQTAAPPGTMPATSSNPAIPSDHESERKAKALLDQMIEALGGQAYLNIQDISQEGRGYTFHLGRPNSYGTVFWRFYKFPDKDRMELTKQRDVVEILLQRRQRSGNHLQGQSPRRRQGTGRLPSPPPLLARLGDSQMAERTGDCALL